MDPSKTLTLNEKMCYSTEYQVHVNDMEGHLAECQKMILKITAKSVRGDLGGSVRRSRIKKPTPGGLPERRSAVV